jgi:hypothetical protein
MLSNQVVRRGVIPLVLLAAVLIYLLVARSGDQAQGHAYGTVKLSSTLSARYSPASRSLILSGHVQAKGVAAASAVLLLTCVASSSGSCQSFRLGAKVSDQGNWTKSVPVQALTGAPSRPAAGIPAVVRHESFVLFVSPTTPAAVQGNHNEHDTSSPTVTVNVT